MKLGFKNICLVEDDEDDRMFFEDALTEIINDFNLTIFENGEQFMSYVLENPAKLPDVVFMDLNMPKKNGIECLLDLNAMQLLEVLKVFIYSTSMDPSSTDKAFKLGAYGYLCKPSSYILIKAMIKESLNKIEFGRARPNFDDFLINL